MLHSGLDAVPRRQARRSLSHATVEMGARLESTRNDAMPFTDKRGAALREHSRLSLLQSTSRINGFRDTLYCAGSYCVDAWPPLQSHGTLHVIVEPCLEPSIIYNSPWPRTAPRPPTRQLQLSMARSRRERLQLYQRGSRFLAVRSPWICRF